MSPAMIRSSVDFPQPDGPTTARNSPPEISNDTFSSTTRGPVGSSYSFVTDRTETATGRFVLPADGSPVRATAGSSIDSEFYGSHRVKSPPHEAVQEPDHEDHRDD